MRKPENTKKESPGRVPGAFKLKGVQKLKNEEEICDVLKCCGFLKYIYILPADFVEMMNSI